MRKQITYILIFVLWVILSVVIIAWIRYNYSPRLSTTTAGYNGALQNDTIDYLFIGSSIFRHAIDPSMFDTSLSKRCYVLHYNGLQPWSMYEIIKYLVTNDHIFVRNLFIDIYPYAAMEEPSMKDSRLFTDAPAELKTILLKRLGSFPTQISLTGKYELLIAANNELFITYPLTKSVYNNMSYKGGYINKTIDGMNRMAFDTLSDPPELRQLKNVHPIQKKAYCQIRTFCLDNNINLIALNVPKPIRVENALVYSTGKSQLTALMDSLSIKTINISDSLFNTNDETLFMDRVHLSSKGRQIFCRQLINQIQ